MKEREYEHRNGDRNCVCVRCVPTTAEDQLAQGIIAGHKARHRGMKLPDDIPGTFASMKYGSGFKRGWKVADRELKR